MKRSVTVTAPGDKSITHRALLLAALAPGPSRIAAALTALDTRSHAGMLRRLGVAVTPLRTGAVVTVNGVGLGRLRQPTSVLDAGNSGTAARLVLGAVAGCPIEARLTGDGSLRRRPMGRVTQPLERMGARFDPPSATRLPLTVFGGPLRSLAYESPVASAQVKSALLLAGLQAGVEVTVSEPHLSRDHTERMLRALGVEIECDGCTARMRPPSSIEPFELRVPGDPSSAAFMAGIGVLRRRALTVRSVALNPTRTGFLAVLRRMGATVDVVERGVVVGEPVGDLHFGGSALQATTVSPGEVPSLIDEIPLLAVLASRAEGISVFRGVAELRVKESDRLALLESNLRAVGVTAEADRDTLTVEGPGPVPRGSVETANDHRMAMAFAVLGTVDGANIRLSEDRSPAVSYPEFFNDLARVVGR